MPATPRYAIPYPCEGDAITLATFADFAAGVEAATATVDALRALSLSRPSAQIAAAAQNATVAVALTVVFSTEVWDTDSMANLGVNADRLTIQTPGVYMFAGFSLGTAGTTNTTNALLLTKNGTMFAEEKNQTNTANGSAAVTVTGMSSCAAGDIIRLQYLWTGTGGPISVAPTLTARMVCRA